MTSDDKKFNDIMLLAFQIKCCLNLFYDNSYDPLLIGLLAWCTVLILMKKYHGIGILMWFQDLMQWQCSKLPSLALGDFINYKNSYA